MTIEMIDKWVTNFRFNEINILKKMFNWIFNRFYFLSRVLHQSRDFPGVTSVLGVAAKWETHKDTAVSVWACQAGFWKSTGTSCQLQSKPMRYSMGFAKSHSLKCSLHKWAWCDAARKSARLNCINLIHFRLTAGRLRGSSCIVIPGVICELLQFAATQ